MPTQEETIAALAERFAAEEAALEMQAAEQRGRKVLSILADRARWGWAVIRHHEFYSAIRWTAEAAESDVDGGGLRAQSVLSIPGMAGSSLVIRLTEEELADLGPCPNL